MHVYLAGGLFNAGERLHNLYLEKYLTKLGYTVILPQRRANQFIQEGIVSHRAIASDCREQCSRKDALYIGSVDGPDADSGTSIEYGIAITTNGKAIVYKTDFRLGGETNEGLNAMFLLNGTHFVYSPCFFTELSEVDEYYRSLAQAIHEEVKKL